MSDTVVYKYCFSREVVRWGSSRGKKLYRCSSCGHKFSGNGSFPCMRVKHQVIVTALDLYFEGLSVRKVQKQIENIYGVRVSQVTVWKWIMKYARLVSEFIQRLRPVLSEKWHVDETVIRAGGEQRWFWEVIDRETRFLVATHLSGERTIDEVVELFRKGLDTAKARPKQLVVDGLWAYVGGYKEVFYSRYKAERVEPVRNAGIRAREKNNLVERLHGTLKDRLKTARGLKTAGTLLTGWAIHYNYVRKHQSIGKTPAQAAGLEISGGWMELITLATQQKTMEEKHGQTKVTEQLERAVV